ncbi:hypothetical protein [Streptomyces griseorubiginosus]|uniref:hypothetical protein n=1 Tax=Streptomyces griseorubiginosus TaxID=67304 RepID=UPI001140240E
MAGFGEDWLNDRCDVGGIDSGLWVSGVDYVAGWREARVVADRLNRALVAAGFEPTAVRAVASTDEDGDGVVRLAARPGAVERLAGLLEECAHGDGGAA